MLSDLGHPAPGQDDIAAEPARRSPRWHGRTLLAVTLTAVLVATASVAFRWGASGQSDDAAAPRPAASPSGEAPWTVSEIYQTLLPSVVFIKATGKDSSTATGTGLVVNADGTVLTALHVVRDSSAIEVAFADGTTSAAAIAAQDPSIDIATLTVKTLPTVVVPAVLGGGSAVGDQVVAIGNPLGLIGSTTSGVVSGLDRGITADGAGRLEGLIQFDAAVNPGSSGGPLINSRGQTIGIVVALANPTDAGTFVGVGFAVPVGAAVGAGTGTGRPPQL